MGLRGNVGLCDSQTVSTQSSDGPSPRVSGLSGARSAPKAGSTGWSSHQKEQEHPPVVSAEWAGALQRRTSEIRSEDRKPDQVTLRENFEQSKLASRTERNLGSAGTLELFVKLRSRIFLWGEPDPKRCRSRSVVNLDYRIWPLCGCSGSQAAFWLYCLSRWSKDFAD